MEEFIHLFLKLNFSVFQKIIFLIALCPIFYTRGMTPQEYMKNMKPFVNLAQRNWKKKNIFETSYSM